MRFRDDVLTYAKDMGTSGTVVINLDYADPISQLIMEFNATNGATSNKDNPIERNISSVDIVDGSDVLWSLPGDVAYGAHVNEFGWMNNQNFGSNANMGQWVTLTIPFGRFLYDQEYAFNPRAHRNPQLRITFDEATVRAAGATGFVSDSFTVSVIAALMEDVPAPRAYLMSKDIYDFTTVVSGDVQIDLPTDYRYRQLMLRIYEQGSWFGSNINNARLSIDGGKFNVFDMNLELLTDRHMATYHQTHRWAEHVMDDGETIATWLALGGGESMRSHTAGRIVGAASHEGAQIVVYHQTHAGASVNAGVIHMDIQGWMPQNVLQYNFGRLSEPQDWFNAPAYNSLKLYLTQANAGAEVNVCLQQVRPY